MSPKPFTETQVAALTALSELWGSDRIVLIGASALGCFLEMKWRKTHDLDLSLSLSINEYPAGLDRLAGWMRHLKKEHEWTSPEGVTVDIVPCSPESLEAGEVVWPESGFRMSLVGFRLVAEHAVALPVAAAFTMRVAPLPVIAMLKMVAYLDRPSVRERDLQDLGYMLESYLAKDEERRYAPAIIDRGLSFELTNAFLLGGDLSKIVGPAEREVVLRFLAGLRDENEATGARMIRLAPAAWREDPDRMLHCLRAFEDGFGEQGGSTVD